MGSGARWEESLSADGGLEARRSKSGYKADIARCLHALRLGDSYELCLTTQLRRKAAVDARKLYSDLRGSNPSAHAAWLSFGEGLPTVSLRLVIAFCFSTCTFFHSWHAVAIFLLVSFLDKARNEASNGSTYGTTAALDFDFCRIHDTYICNNSVSACVFLQLVF